MSHRFLSPLLLSLSLVGLGVACSDDGGTTTSEGTETGDGDGDMTGDGDGDPTTTGDGDGDPATGDGDGDGDTGDGDGDTTGDGDGDTTGDGDGDTGDGDGDTGGALCQIWEIEYDLTGSEFEISGTPIGAGDQLNIVEEPYDDDDKIGPGSFIVRFQDVDGQPNGTAWLVGYQMTLNFTISSFGATVETDLEQNAGPGECGLTSAVLEGDVANWDPMELGDYLSMGTITCNGNLCGLGGLPDGEPQEENDMGPGPLAAFDFSGDRAMFSTETFVVQMDDNSTTTWNYIGNEISRQLIDAPDCLCE